jgi:hypothetical protein
MFNRHWSNGLAIGLTAGGLVTIVLVVTVIGLNYCPGDPCNYPGHAQDYPENDPTQSKWNVPDPLRGTFNSQVEPEYRESNPTRHEYYDLRAQERMAHATDWIAWITFVSSFFGVVGVGLLVWTLGEQRNANSIAQRIGEAQSRAYVTFSNLGFSLINPGDGTEARSLVFEMFWDIDGQSPALNVKTGVTSKVDAQDANIAFLGKQSEDNKKRDYGTVKSRKIGSIIVDFDKLEEAFRSGKVLWILARLEYEDVFGSMFFYSEKINLSPSDATLKVGIKGKKPAGFIINSEGIWGNIEDSPKGN